MLAGLLVRGANFGLGKGTLAARPSLDYHAEGRHLTIAVRLEAMQEKK